MGLSIHYSGRLKKVESLSALIEEVRDISEIYKWKYTIFETNFPNDTFENKESFEKIYGICFTPTNCETIFLTFLSNGTMVSHNRIPFFAYSEDETEKSYIYFVSVKTQFAGIITHLMLIRLFKYLNNKYFEDFKFSDESMYWETDDENLAREKFKLYDNLLDNVVLSIQTFPMESDENITSYFERLMTHVDKLRKNEAN